MAARPYVALQIVSGKKGSGRRSTKSRKMPRIRRRTRGRYPGCWLVDQYRYGRDRHRRRQRRMHSHTQRAVLLGICVRRSRQRTLQVMTGTRRRMNMRSLRRAHRPKQQGNRQHQPTPPHRRQRSRRATVPEGTYAMELRNHSSLTVYAGKSCKDAAAISTKVPLRTNRGESGTLNSGTGKCTAKRGIPLRGARLQRLDPVRAAP